MKNPTKESITLPKSIRGLNKAIQQTKTRTLLFRKNKTPPTLASPFPTIQQNPPNPTNNNSLPHVGNVGNVGAVSTANLPHNPAKPHPSPPHSRINPLPQKTPRSQHKVSVQPPANARHHPTDFLDKIILIYSSFGLGLISCNSGTIPQ